MNENKNPYVARRIGNIVRYTGRLADYTNTFGEIVSIEQLNDGEDTYILKVQNWKKEPQEIRAYFPEVADVLLNENLLEKVGFQKDHDREVYNYKNINMINPYAYRQSGQGAVEVEFKGWLVVTKDIKLPLKEKDVTEKTVSVPALHALQNYLIDHYQINIDTEQFIGR